MYCLLIALLSLSTALSNPTAPVARQFHKLKIEYARLSNGETDAVGLSVPVIKNVLSSSPRRSLTEVGGSLVDFEVRFDEESGRGRSLACRNLQEVSYALGDFCGFDSEAKVEVRRNGGLTNFNFAPHVCGGSLARRLRYVSQDQTCSVVFEEDGSVHGSMTVKGVENASISSSIIEFTSSNCSDTSKIECLEISRHDNQKEDFDLDFTNDGIRALQTEEDITPFFLDRASNNCYDDITSELPNILFYGFVVSSHLSSELNNDIPAILRHVEYLLATNNMVYIQQLNFRIVASHLTILLDNPNGGPNGIWSSTDFSSFNEGTCSITETLFNNFRDLAPQRLTGSWVLLTGSCGGAGGLGSIPGICLTDAKPGAVVVSRNDNFYAYKLVHEIGHNFGINHLTSGEGVMQAAGVHLRNNEIEFAPSSIDQACPTIREKIPFCLRDDIDTLNGAIMNPSVDDSFKSNCECNPANQCCRSDCSFADTSVICETEDGHGYCRNGACEGLGERCKRSINAGSDFCGVEEDNPCIGRCAINGGICNTIVNSFGVLKEDSKCSNGTHDGLCDGSTCIILSTRAILDTENNDSGVFGGGGSAGSVVFAIFAAVVLSLFLVLLVKNKDDINKENLKQSGKQMAALTSTKFVEGANLAATGGKKAYQTTKHVTLRAAASARTLRQKDSNQTPTGDTQSGDGTQPASKLIAAVGAASILTVAATKRVAGKLNTLRQRDTKPDESATTPAPTPRKPVDKPPTSTAEEPNKLNVALQSAGAAAGVASKRVVKAFKSLRKAEPDDTASSVVAVDDPTPPEEPVQPRTKRIYESLKSAKNSLRAKLETPEAAPEPQVNELAKKKTWRKTTPSKEPEVPKESVREKQSIFDKKSKWQKAEEKPVKYPTNHEKKKKRLSNKPKTSLFSQTAADTNPKFTTKSQPTSKKVKKKTLRRGLTADDTGIAPRPSVRDLVGKFSKRDV